MNSPLRRAHSDGPQTRTQPEYPACPWPERARPLFLGHLTEPERMEDRRDPFLRPPGREA
ncbi:MAG: hypothetical protein AB1698_12200 [Pseudomonadota bacterium]